MRNDSRPVKHSCGSSNFKTLHARFNTSQRIPEHCTGLKFRQHRVKPCHPAHHCDLIWPSTGNITNTESLCRHHRVLAPCQKGCAFYSLPTLQAECRKYAAGRSKGGVERLVTHPHSSIHLSGLCVNVSGAPRESEKLQISYIF